MDLRFSGWVVSRFWLALSGGLGVWFGCLRGWVCCGVYLWVSGPMVLWCCCGCFDFSLLFGAILLGWFVTICYGVVVCLWFTLGFAVGFGLVCCWVTGSLLAAYLCFGVVVLLRCGFGLDSAVCSWFSLGVWVLGDFGGCGASFKVASGCGFVA